MTKESELDWETRSKIEELKNSEEYGLLANLYETVGLYKNALESYYLHKDFISALRVAKEHVPDAVEEVYERVSKKALNGLSSDVRQFELICKEGRARRIGLGIFLKKAKEFERKGDLGCAANVYKTLGAKKRAAELYERNAAKGNCASLVDAAELYEEMGDIRRAAMLYEKHGAYPGKVAEFYEQLGEFRKAAVIYEHFSSTHKKSASIYRQLNDTAAIEKLWEKRCEQLSFIDLIDEAAKEYDTEGRVARAALLQNINKLINIQSVEKIFPEIAGEIKSPVEYIDDLCKNESNKRKIIKMATCGTNFYSVERDSGVTDNFGCSDVETYHYLDLEVKGLKPEAIFISGIYLLARNDWKDLAIPERATAYQNIHNIWQYKEAGGRLEVLIKDNAR